MRFMILVKADASTEAGVMPEGDALIGLMAEMATYHEALAQAGVLLDAAGLQPSAKGWRLHYDGAQRTLIDGPFAEAKELVAGYTLIQVRSRDEAMEWARRFPNPSIDGGQAVIEVRQLYELEDFAPSDAAERFRDMKTSSH